MSVRAPRGGRKEPLYRKVNTTAHGVHHRAGGDFSDVRASAARKAPDATRESMHGKVRRGLDYTPLYRFLVSRVGSPWREVQAEAVSRLDRPDPIFELVARDADAERPYVRTGESSYFSGLRVDDAGVLQFVDPAVGPDTLAPSCRCCTHTFNGVRFTQSYGVEPGAA